MDPDPATPEELAGRLVAIFDRVKAKKAKARRRTHPAFVANGPRFGPGNDIWRLAPRCEKCRDVAVRGTKVCRRHGGAAAVAKRETGDTPRYMARTLLRWMRRGVLPAELTAHPLWQRCILGARIHHEALAAMAIAWSNKQTHGDVSAWIAAQEQARQSLASHGHPIPDR